MSPETREGQPEVIPELISEQTPTIFAWAATQVDNLILGRVPTNEQLENLNLAFKILDNNIKSESERFTEDPGQIVFWHHFFRDNVTIISKYIDMEKIKTSRDVLMLRSFFIGSLKGLYETHNPKEFGLVRDNFVLLSQHVANELN